MSLIQLPSPIITIIVEYSKNTRNLAAANLTFRRKFAQVLFDNMIVCNTKIYHFSAKYNIVIRHIKIFDFDKFARWPNKDAIESMCGGSFITRIHRDIADCAKLKKLDLSMTSERKLDEKLPDLIFLNCKYTITNLANLPKSLKILKVNNINLAKRESLPNIEHLTIYKSPSVDCSYYFKIFPNLISLEVNDIHKLDAALIPKTIKKLKVSHHLFDIINPGAFADLYNLEELTLSTRVHEHIVMPTITITLPGSIKKLNIARCQSIRISNESLPNLKKISLAHRRQIKLDIFKIDVDF